MHHFILFVAASTRQAMDIQVELQRYGLAVEPASTIDVALNIIHEQTPAAIILDVDTLTVPDMDWYEMCQLLTSNPATAPLPVITLTRESEAYIALRAIHAGACDCISYDMFVVRNLVEALRNLNVL